MKLVLMTKGLWSIVTGTDMIPNSDGKEIARRYTERRDQTLAGIFLSIGEYCSASVIDLEDPKEVLDFVEEQFNAISTAAAHSLLESYQAIRMEPNEIVMPNVNRLSYLEKKLASNGKPVDGHEKRRALLGGRNEDFDHVLDMIRGLDNKRPASIGMMITKEISLNKRHNRGWSSKDAALSM